MTKIKHVLKLVAFTVVAVLMAVVLDLDITACSNVADSGGRSDFTNFQISPDSIEIKVGEDEDLTITVEPSDGVTFEAVSGDTSKATVTVSGNTVTVRGVASGNTTIRITAKKDGYKDKTGSVGVTTYLGDKSPTAAKAVGDIVFKDGSAIPYNASLNLTQDQKDAAVAVIFRAASNGKPALGVGKNNGQTPIKWCTDQADGYDKNITALQNITDGSTSLEILRRECSDANGADFATKYPAWAFCADYGKNNGLTGTPFETGWYLPTVDELTVLNDNRDTLKDSIDKAGGNDKAFTNMVWSCCQYSPASTNKEASTFGLVAGWGNGPDHLEKNKSYQGLGSNPSGNGYNTYGLSVRAFN